MCPTPLVELADELPEGEFEVEDRYSGVVGAEEGEFTAGVAKYLLKAQSLDSAKKANCCWKSRRPDSVSVGTKSLSNIKSGCEWVGVIAPSRTASKVCAIQGDGVAEEVEGACHWIGA